MRFLPIDKDGGLIQRNSRTADLSDRAVEGVGLPLRLLRLRIRFTPGVWMSAYCECCVFR
jgi:hypothetical protein